MISRKRAVEIGEDWYSVNTWSDPGVALYAFTSTAGWVQSEEHRQNCLSYLRLNLADIKAEPSQYYDPEVCEIELRELIEYIARANLRPKLDYFTAGYVRAALWTLTGDPLGHHHTVDDFSPEAMKEILEVCADFQKAHSSPLERYVAAGRNMEQAGVDFWLTRNGHGAGFWDRGLGELGDELSEMARPYGTCDIYVGDDGRLHI